MAAGDRSYPVPDLTRDDKVTLSVQVRKLQADGNGKETPMPLHDLIDIGIFSGKKDEEKPLA